jgi:hypothetical protein
MALYGSLNGFLTFVYSYGEDDADGPSRPLYGPELKRMLDGIAEGVGLKFAEQLLFLQLLNDIGGTDDVGNKILRFIRHCVELNKHTKDVDWAADHLPKRYTSIKRNIDKKLKELNRSTDAATGTTSTTTTTRTA